MPRSKTAKKQPPDSDDESYAIELEKQLVTREDQNKQRGRKKPKRSPQARADPAESEAGAKASGEKPEESKQIQAESDEEEQHLSSEDEKQRATKKSKPRPKQATATEATVTSTSSSRALVKSDDYGNVWLQLSEQSDTSMYDKHRCVVLGMRHGNNKSSRQYFAKWKAEDTSNREIAFGTANQFSTVGIGADSFLPARGGYDKEWSILLGPDASANKEFVWVSPSDKYKNEIRKVAVQVGCDSVGQPIYAARMSGSSAIDIECIGALFCGGSASYIHVGERKLEVTRVISGFEILCSVAKGQLFSTSEPGINRAIAEHRSVLYSGVSEADEDSAALAPPARKNNPDKKKKKKKKPVIMETSSSSSSSSSSSNELEQEEDRTASEDVASDSDESSYEENIQAIRNGTMEPQIYEPPAVPVSDEADDDDGLDSSIVVPGPNITKWVEVTPQSAAAFYRSHPCIVAGGDAENPLYVARIHRAGETILGGADTKQIVAVSDLGEIFVSNDSWEVLLAPSDEYNLGWLDSTRGSFNKDLKTKAWLLAGNADVSLYVANAFRFGSRCVGVFKEKKCLVASAKMKAVPATAFRVLGIVQKPANLHFPATTTRTWEDFRLQHRGPLRAPIEPRIRIDVRTAISELNFRESQNNRYFEGAAKELEDYKVIIRVFPDGIGIAGFQLNGFTAVDAVARHMAKKVRDRKVPHEKIDVSFRKNMMHTKRYLRGGETKTRDYVVQNPEGLAIACHYHRDPVAPAPPVAHSAPGALLPVVVDMPRPAPALHDPKKYSGLVTASIFATLCCAPVCGIAAWAFAKAARADHKDGSYASAKSNAKWAKWMLIFSVFTGVGVLIGVLVGRLFIGR